MVQKVVVPIDFNPNTNEVALDLALEHTENDAEIVLVTVSQSGEKDDREKAMREDVVEEALEYLKSTEHGDRSIQHEVLSGKVAQSVCNYAEKSDADMIVMTTEGHSGFKRVVLGSVSQKIIQNARCPVLVVNGRNQQQEEEEE